MARSTRCSPVCSTVRNAENGCGAHPARARAAGIRTISAALITQIQNVNRSRSRVWTWSRRSSSSWNRFWGRVRIRYSLQHSLERVTYDSRTREVGVTLVDGSHFGYTLPVTNRPGVRRQFRQEFGRVPRVSRLMALALKFQGLLSESTVRNHAELAELGHVSRTRVCQILMLTNLAPAIQEALLFLPKTLNGPDRITENRLRGIASLIDWNAQIRLFRSRLAGSQR
jgi:hypothetical protein